ncbi:transposase family protein [Streptomyces sp. NPDC001068]|uniref:transposase family protein n=1 Tax=Streptomyces sp. NPDC001068 TaxID=3364544 RepID=UPI0036867AEA
MTFVGTLLPIDRSAADRPHSSGKHRRHGMNVQVIADPFGRLLWASPALSGAVHDIRAARTHDIIDTLTDADVNCWADMGYQGVGGAIRVPMPRQVGEALRRPARRQRLPRQDPRALGGQAMATLKSWRLLRRLPSSTTRITDLVKAVLTLHLTTSN